ncbi:MAG: hypothetical protein AB8B67_01505 [Rickettsiaceae bacterium]
MIKRNLFIVILIVTSFTDVFAKDFFVKQYMPNSDNKIIKSDRPQIIGAFLSHGFIVSSKQYNFTKKIKSGSCNGTVLYPKFSTNNEHGVMSNNINDDIESFVESYMVCNSKHNNVIAKYDTHFGHIDDILSIKWSSYNNDSLIRIDALNFNKISGSMLSLDDILNDSAQSMISAIVQLSQGRLSSSISWAELIDEVHMRRIQFYIDNSKWYIVFNSPLNTSVPPIVKEIPSYLLKV